GQMNPQLINKLSKELRLSENQVKAVLMLFDGGATVPFIARYRKEMTNSLNEVQITAIRDGMNKMQDLEKRRASILKSIEEQGKLTPQLEKQILQAENMTRLEDLYLPFKSKRRTRATMAKEKGLEPLAKMLMSQQNIDVDKAAEKFVDAKKDVNDDEEALAGARDIIAEWVNEDPKARSRMRRLFERKATIQAKLVKGKEKEAEKFRDYFDWDEPLKRVPSHRLLAILRGVNEGFLRLNIAPDQNDALELLDDTFLKADNEAAEQVQEAITDAYKRLMRPSMETEIRNDAKAKADADAIKVFTTNLRELLLSPPLGQKNVMAIDPGFRTGCKIVCLDKQGQLLQYTTIFPHDRTSTRRFEAVSTVEKLCKKFDIEAVAIGNGTAGRETMEFIKKIHLENITLVMVNESGASIYSASEVARQEFPDHDLTVRGSVSIGRRLMDPLAELVKIDPKSIGVGQYQHDVDQKLLRQSLDDTVVSCVNNVGVEVNTASKELLTYLSGVGPKLAQNIVTFRNENGAFKNKKQLKKVSGLGPKAFEQSAGFIRIRNAKNPLDASAVHPESYGIVEQMAKDVNATVLDLVKDAELRKQINPKNYVTEKVGLPTLNDILQELAKPGRDPREQFEQLQFQEGINSIEDLEEGMILPGIITNVTNFGAFVDIGVHQDGLVHVSQIVNRFIRDPKQVVKVNQKVKVKVMTVDVERKRINLSMKQA
ncbi:MAG: Tex family protein, partial [Chitinophagales bacterium]